MAYMRVGLDFDNTIVSYDEVFHKVALEQSLIPADLPKSKLAVRDYLRKIGREDSWTEMQGYVYGARMADASAYPGCIDFIRTARENGINLFIVSHKTKYPFAGPKFDLHSAARDWIEGTLIADSQDLIAAEAIFFESTKEDKIRRIAEIGCDYFVDDLPEILLMSGFPDTSGRILFDPEDTHSVTGIDKKVTSWSELVKFFEARWTLTN